MRPLRGTYRMFLAAVACALLFALLPLPTSLAVMKPMLLALVLAYFALEAPEVAGLGHAFLFGLAADVLYGGLLGEHALRMVILVYLTLRFRHRLRFFPIWQQAGAVFALLLNDRVLDLWIRLLSGSAWPPLLFWLSPPIGMAVWPWVFLLLDGLRLRRRQQQRERAN
ncbi:MAG: rod shape-determining protein MreD [Xanthomonadales bacterium]|nr:Rod shape-determining protein MreD [Xanthomonadales bacterium]MCC6594170.1 rod shape-determining protein MreD [Xanthomonadales bacterium]MCE7931861.1 rod shape-determining protein MreD [Xanthomonadales bacterium PRO6]